MDTKGHCFPKSIIIQAVYFKLRFSLSYRDIEEIMRIRGVEVDFATIQRWVSRITYKNAIGVPYFERIPDINTETPDSIRTWLHFEYRELTNEEHHSNIFVDTSFHGICLSNIGPPIVNMYMITKIIDYH